MEKITSSKTLFAGVAVVTMAAGAILGVAISPLASGRAGGSDGR